jgi:hypothetical protein
MSSKPTKEFKYVDDPNSLPDIHDCAICFDKIDLDQLVNHAPNCVICENGHRMHQDCLKQWENVHNKDVIDKIHNICPSCKAPVKRFCKSRDPASGEFRYSYVSRKGGKRTKRRKCNKKRKTKSKRRRHY